ncbi:hypothetical protein J5J84_13235 [Alcaligenes faecalis]|nr:hypothetical protein J5J84_13235 [Alcaligenes faecalis]
MTIPAWVDDEIRNWSRMHWEGDYPGPRRVHMDSKDCLYPFRAVDDDYEDQVPVNYERARKVEAVYQQLCHAERRVVQAESTRIKEYGNSTDHIRAERASRKIGVSPLYYRLALRDFKIKVWRALG